MSGKKIAPFLFFMAGLLASWLQAMEIKDEAGIVSNSEATNTRYFHGDFIALEGMTLHTNGGVYPLTNLAKIVDRRSDTEAGGAKVQLTIRNDIVIQVVIYE